MRSTPQFRFTLTSELLGRLLLKNDPEGWDDLGLSIHRDPKYHGITTEYSNQLAFVKEGKDYLERSYQLRGIQAQVTLLIEIFNANDFLWYPYYQGKVAFRAREVDAIYFRCNIENEGFMQKFLNRDNVTVDLLKQESIGGVALPDLLPQPLLLHSKAILQQYDAVVPDPAPPPLSDFMVKGENRTRILYFGFNQVNTDEFDLAEVFSGSVEGETPVPIYTLKESGEFTFDFSIAAHLKVKRTGNGNGDFDSVDGGLYFRINDEEPVAFDEFEDTDIDGGFFRQVTAEHKITRTMKAGDQIFLYGRLYVHDITEGVFGYRFEVINQLNAGFFKMTALTTTINTETQGLLVYEALERVCQSMTDQRDAFRSSYFGRTDTVPAYAVDGDGSLVYTMGGFQARGFPLDKRPLTAEWRPLFDSLSAIFWLGAGVERLPDATEVVRVEPAAYFYDDQIVLDLAGPVAVKTRTLADRHYNALEFGYQKWQSEQVNGLDEFNTRREWSLPLTEVKSVYSAVSTYITSGFYLEKLRRQHYEASTTTDDSRDSDNFFVCLLRTDDGFETERDQNFPALDGILSPSTAYNVRLSPARMLRRHAPAFAAGLQRELNKLVRFTFGEGNNEFSSQLAAETAAIVEKQDVPVSALPAPFWLPESDTFTAPIDREQLALLLLNPRGRIRYRTAKGEVHEGWLLDFSMKKQEGEFTILRAANLLAS